MMEIFWILSFNGNLHNKRLDHFRRGSCITLSIELYNVRVFFIMSETFVIMCHRLLESCHVTLSYGDSSWHNFSHYYAITEVPHWFLTLQIKSCSCLHNLRHVACLNCSSIPTSLYLFLDIIIDYLTSRAPFKSVIEITVQNLPFSCDYHFCSQSLSSAYKRLDHTVVVYSSTSKG